MNRAQIVRFEATQDTATLRLWIDDEAGHHLAVAELEIPRLRMMVMAMECQRRAEDAAQLALFPLEP